MLQRHFDVKRTNKIKWQVHTRKGKSTHQRHPSRSAGLPVVRCYYCTLRNWLMLLSQTWVGLLITKIFSSAARSSPCRSMTVTLAPCPDGWLPDGRALSIQMSAIKGQGWHRDARIPSRRCEPVPVGRFVNDITQSSRGLSLVADQYSQIYTNGLKQGFAGKRSDREQRRVQLIQTETSIPINS